MSSTGTHFPVTHSVLSEADLARWVDDAYGASGQRECRLVSESINQTYQLRRDGDAAYLRVSRAGARSFDEMAREAALVRYLAGRGLRVAAPIRRRDGGDVGEIAVPEGARFVILYAAADGDGVRDITPSHSRAYGRLAAGIHAATDATGGEFDRFVLDTAHLIDNPLAAIQERLGADAPDEVAYLSGIAARVKPRISALPRTAPEFGICHGDLHPGNVRFNAAGEPTVFDFDCYGPGWRAYDLAVFLWNSYLERRPKAWRAARWNAFLRGYRDVGTLSPEVVAATPLFLVARQICLMGYDCAGMSGWLPQWIDAGWLRSMNGYVRGWIEEYPILR